MDEKLSKRQRAVRTGLFFVDRTLKDHVPAYAASASYFLIMSFIPFVMLLSTLIRYTPITYNMLRDLIIDLLPESVQAFILGVVSDVYRRNGALIPISAIAALWAAGKGIQAITNGLNTIYHVKETRNWLITRIYSVAYTLLFSISVVGSLVLLVLGEQLTLLIKEYNPILARLLERIVVVRTLFTLPILFLIFLILYKYLPNRKTTFRRQMPGAIGVAVAWIVFSALFSLYFQIFPGFSNMYGNMAAAILIMVWLYCLMNILLYGAELNFYLETEVWNKREESP